MPRIQPEPIHATVPPVAAYAEFASKTLGKTFHVITIPEGSTAHQMGYRYASVSDEELPDYLRGGATLVPPRKR